MKLFILPCILAWLFGTSVSRAADYSRSSTVASGACPIPRVNEKEGHQMSCSGLPRTTVQAQDDRPVYFNVSGRHDLHLIRSITAEKADCRPKKPIPKLSIRYESNVAFRKQAENAIRVANQMSYLLTRGACGAEKGRTSFDMNNASHDHYFYSLVRNTFSIDEKVLGAGIIFRQNALTGKEYFAPYSLQGNSSFYVRDKATRIGLEEKQLLAYLTEAAKNRTFACHTSTFTPKLNNKDDVSVNFTQPYVEYIDGLWGRPYFECVSTKKWLVPYMAPFFQLNYSAPRKDILNFM